MEFTNPMPLKITEKASQRLALSIALRRLHGPRLSALQGIRRPGVGASSVASFGLGIVMLSVLVFFLAVLGTQPPGGEAVMESHLAVARNGIERDPNAVHVALVGRSIFVDDTASVQVDSSTDAVVLEPLKEALEATCRARRCSSAEFDVHWATPAGPVKSLAMTARAAGIPEVSFLVRRPENLTYVLGF